MKYLTKTLLLTLSSFTLMSCPPGHFHEYKFIGKGLPYDGLDYIRIGFNEKTDLYIKAGYYYEFINKKENGLAVAIKTDPKFDLQKNKIIKGIKSSVFGKLSKSGSLPYKVCVYHTENTILYNLPFTNRNERRTLKMMSKDTITITLMNGRELFFIRSE